MNVYRHPRARCATRLLSESGLPTSDLSPDDFANFLGCGDERDPDGVVGLELLGSEALLRSLAVKAGRRSRGCGKRLVRAAEALARAEGVECLYLLTETAEDFFSGLGYERIDRSAVPDAIGQTDEFSTLCPDSAVVMRKRLAA